MDVTCESCGAEYEFDETLISKHGTTVKCTSCGHLFKVFLSDGSGALPWILRRVDGTESTLATLRELQSAIAKGQATEEDEISRTGITWKRLRDIVELKTFFAAATARVTVPESQQLIAEEDEAATTEHTAAFDATEHTTEYNQKHTIDYDDQTVDYPSSRVVEATYADDEMPTGQHVAIGGNLRRNRPDATIQSLLPPPSEEAPSRVIQAPQAADVTKAEFSSVTRARNLGAAETVPNAATTARGNPQTGPEVTLSEEQTPTIEMRTGGDATVRPGRRLTQDEDSGPVRVPKQGQSYEPAERGANAPSAPPLRLDAPSKPMQEAPSKVAAQDARQEKSNAGLWAFVILLLGSLVAALLVFWPEVQSFISGEPAADFLAEGDTFYEEGTADGFERAIEEYTRATATDSRAYLRLAEARLGLATLRHFEAADLEAQAARMEAASSASPQDSENAGSGGTEQADPGTTAEIASIGAEARVLRREVETLARAALGDTEEILREDATNADAEARVAQANWLLGDAQVAEHHLARAKELGESATVRFVSGLILREQADFERAEALSSDNLLTRLASARLDLEEGRVSSARRRIDSMLELSSSYPPALDLQSAINLGRPPAPATIAVGASEVDTTEAHEDTTEAREAGEAGATGAEAAPENAVDRNDNRPGTNSPDSDSAEGDLPGRVVDDVYEPPQGEQELANSANRPNIENDGANRNVEAEVTNGPPPPGRDYSWYVDRAESFIRSGQRDLSADYYRAALRVRRSGSEALSGLGYYEFERRNYGSAITYFQQARRNGYASAFIGLGDAYNANGQRDEAIEVFQDYLRRHPNGGQANVARRKLTQLGAPVPSETQQQEEAGPIVDEPGPGPIVDEPPDTP